MKHLFLTGHKQVGKSTLLNHLIDACKLNVTGYHTYPIDIQGVKHGYYMHGFCETMPWANDFIICARLGENKLTAIPQAFDLNGVALLKTCQSTGKHWFVMDEIGKVERKSEAFCQEVLHVLDSPVHVLGVLQDCSSPLVESIRARSDVTVITVTEENRNELLTSLIDWVHQIK